MGSRESERASVASVLSVEERPWFAFAGSRVSFASEGGPGVPDLYEEISPRGEGPPQHRHPWPSWEIVVSGTVRVQIEGIDHTVTAGGTVFIPADAAHAYVIESDEAHVIGVGMSEGRFHRLQVQAPPLLAAAGGPDMAAIAALAASCDTELLGPPLEPTPRED